MEDRNDRLYRPYKIMGKSVLVYPNEMDSGTLGKEPGFIRAGK